MSKKLKQVAGEFAESLLYSGANYAFGRANAKADAKLQEEYNKRAEQRSDFRNRQLIVDTPQLTAKGRARAGLNPFGDATLPGMQGTSEVNPDTSIPDVMSTGAGISQRRSQLDLQERIQVGQLDLDQQRVENERIVAESQADANEAYAERLRGQEFRDSYMLPFGVSKAIKENYGVDLENKYQEMVNDVYNKTKGYKVDAERLNIENLEQSIKIGKQTLINLEKDGKLKDQTYLNLKETQQVLIGQAIQLEISNLRDVFDYTQWTGLDYATGEKVGDGLAQIAYDKATYDAEQSKFNAGIAEIDLEYSEIHKIVSLVVDGVTVADIINDDVFAWMSHNEKMQLERDILEFQKSESKNARKTKDKELTMSLFRTFGPMLIRYMLKKL